MIENEDWEPTGQDYSDEDRSEENRYPNKSKDEDDNDDAADTNDTEENQLTEEATEGDIPVERYSEKQKMRIFDGEFLPHIDAMYNFAFRLTFDEDDAKDLVQETYLKAFRFINSFEEGTNAKAWLFRILKNSFINDYRKKSKEPAKVDYNDVESYYNSEDAQVEMTTDLRVESLRDMIGDEVSNALNSLAVDFRTVIILCDLEGFTYEEMAKILDIPIGTVRSRLHRARNLLKDKLRSYAQSMGY
ncbi:RNA polymerase sigma factor RpoE [Flammeovirgaceae bacterium 311]|nr:RNA polymerase sigma factor RpoE [Flammeovirgaceae bacterium 311]